MSGPHLSGCARMHWISCRQRCGRGPRTIHRSICIAHFISWRSLNADNFGQWQLPRHVWFSWPSLLWRVLCLGSRSNAGRRGVSNFHSPAIPVHPYPFALAQCLGRRHGCHHCRCAVFTRNNCRVRRRAAAVNNDGNGALKERRRCGIGVRGDQHIACAQPIEFRAVMHNAHRWSFCYARTARRAAQKCVALGRTVRKQPRVDERRAFKMQALLLASDHRRAQFRGLS